MFVRRRPTLPQPLGCSTIGAGRLNFRVRDGSGCFPVAVAAVTLRTGASPPWTPISAVAVGWSSLCGRVVCGDGVVCVLLSLNTCKLVGLLVVLGVCVASVRPISTGRLGIAAVHLRPINPIVCWGPYTLEGWGNLILKRASRLDAFSGYHFRT